MLILKRTLVIIKKKKNHCSYDTHTVILMYIYTNIYAAIIT